MSSARAVQDTESGEEVSHLLVEADHVDLRRTLRFLYFGHFLGRWGAGMWDFLVAMLLIKVGSDSLLLTAIYGLVQAASVALLGAVVGASIDSVRHVKVLQLGVGIRNVSRALSAMTLLLMLVNQHQPWPSLVWYSAVVFVNILGASGILSELACTILLERDWVVTIAELPEQSLTKINSIMKRIDLVCKLLAPAFVGSLMSAISSVACLAATVIWNFLSLALEYQLLYTVYKSTLALRGKDTTELKPLEKQKLNEDATLRVKILNFLMVDGWTAYFQQEVLLAALALALLYCTVLSFGAVMTAAMERRGVPPHVIGLARGLGALFGVGATYLYPKLHARAGTRSAGFWSIWTQWSCLLPSVATVWIHNDRVSVSLLISSVIASRVGLWMFDLSVTQLMQSTVEEAQRGKVGGVQNSLQSVMHMMSFVITMLSPNPQEFGNLVVTSFLVVTAAAMLFSAHFLTNKTMN